MSNTRAEAFAPATVANLGVGFDILGLAVSGAGDTVIVERVSSPGAAIATIEGDGGRLPREADRNVASIAAAAFLKQFAPPFGVRIHLKKGLPLASGLGSSAASATAAVVAVNALMDRPRDRIELLPACLEGEAAVSGYHADNVAPSLLGGITLINGTEADQIRTLPAPEDWHLALITPSVEVLTAQARAALPASIPLKTMIHQTGMVAALVDALYRRDIRAAARAMEQDQVVEPARAHLIPHLGAARQAARAAGALALVISGAGPTLCALCETAETAQWVADAVGQVYAASGLESTRRTGRILESGAQVLSVS